MIDLLSTYLTNRGQKFNQYGYPIFEREMFLDTWPSVMAPFHYRHQIADATSAVICFYSKDCEILPRFDKLLLEVAVYKNYSGVVAADLTVTDDMDKELQQTTILLNQLFIATLSINGIKIVANTRCPTSIHREAFAGIPRNVMCASSTLSCNKLRLDYDFSYLEKILFLTPSKLLIYGKKDSIMLNQLDTLGINFRRYEEIRKSLKGQVQQKYEKVV